MATAASTASEITCWVCLNSSDHADHESRPLLRDCACRGTSGFAHLKCLIRMATAETEASPTEKKNSCSIGTHYFGKRQHNPWAECPTCKCPYEGETQQKLASSMWRRYGNGSKKGDSQHPIPRSLEKSMLRTVARAKANCETQTKEAIGLYKRLLEIEREEQKIYAGRLCTALEKDIVAQEVEVLCELGKCYHDLGNISTAQSLLQEAMDLTKSSRGEGYAFVLRIMSKVHLANGDTNEAVHSIETAVDIMISIPRHDRCNELELLRCLWQLGVVHFAAGSIDQGFNELSDALIAAEHAFGQDYSVVQHWRSEIERYRKLRDGNILMKS